MLIRVSFLNDVNRFTSIRLYLRSKMEYLRFSDAIRYPTNTKHQGGQYGASNNVVFHRNCMRLFLVFRIRLKWVPNYIEVDRTAVEVVSKVK